MELILFVIVCILCPPVFFIWLGCVAIFGAVLARKHILAAVEWLALRALCMGFVIGVIYLVTQ